MTAGIAFMGKDWDRDKGGRREWIAWLSSVLVECLRVAKPGSVLLCWALPRTSHWTGTAIEDAGWIIEDRIAHHFGSGFPKHKSKLKPATEDWWLARKPGGAKWLNVDGCRVPANGDSLGGGMVSTKTEGWDRPWKHDADAVARCKERHAANIAKAESVGRWPANLVLSHSPECNGTCAESCPIRLMGEQGGERPSGEKRAHYKRSSAKGWSGAFADDDGGPAFRSFTGGDTGSAARFFPNFDADPFLYCPKASRKDRGDGNTHPTVKPLALMRWLCRLATPPGGTILDPFLGSGSTGAAAVAEGFGFIGVERDPEYHEIARRRIESARVEQPLFAACGAEA